MPDAMFGAVQVFSPTGGVGHGRELAWCIGSRWLWWPGIPKSGNRGDDSRIHTQAGSKDLSSKITHRPLALPMEARSGPWIISARVEATTSGGSRPSSE